MRHFYEWLSNRILVRRDKFNCVEPANTLSVSVKIVGVNDCLQNMVYEFLNSLCKICYISAESTKFRKIEEKTLTEIRMPGANVFVFIDKKSVLSIIYSLLVKNIYYCCYFTGQPSQCFSCFCLLNE